MGDNIRRGRHGESGRQPSDARTGGGIPQASGVQVGLLLLLVLVNLLVLWLLWSVINAT